MEEVLPPSDPPRGTVRSKSKRGTWPASGNGGSVLLAVSTGALGLMLACAGYVEPDHAARSCPPSANTYLEAAACLEVRGSDTSDVVRLLGDPAVRTATAGQGESWSYVRQSGSVMPALATFEFDEHGILQQVAVVQPSDGLDEKLNRWMDGDGTLAQGRAFGAFDSREEVESSLGPPEMTIVGENAASGKGRITVLAYVRASAQGIGWQMYGCNEAGAVVIHSEASLPSLGEVGGLFGVPPGP